ncbi:MAG TPA: alpha/beta hydrolase [Leptospiraceae bacterium]|nr:alpha/beta hydrolase [Leptospirales bacterium]HMU83343.1 alpha/beta hydrolase [Leptospiraceae bacterium]HMW60013.1 alpha/beta hydrolase [Leptospiraceae bacterium]HMX57666.1 alpha/beta hydrolase [Leptospiraceae bacterium]HMY47025.1 alpha/beta hydrolase [Leptospiraceae bacterium]
MTPDSEEIISGERPPLLLIHDVFSDTDAWAEQIDFLSRQYDVLNFPLSGHRGAQGSSTSSLLEDNRSRLDQIVGSVEMISIIAHGHSCRLAVDLASDFPDRVAQLILISPVLNPLNLMRGLPRFMPFFYEIFFLFADTLGEKGPSFHRPVARLASISAPAMRQWVEEWRALPAPDLTRVQARTLILSGDRMPRVPDPPVGDINENLTNSHLIRFAGMGHFLQKENAATINPLLMDFLNRPEGYLQRGLESVVGFIKGLFGR